MNAVNTKQVSIVLACRTFQISETCYRYERKFDDENAEIADWLVRLTANRKTWGFGLCFLYLRNVKGFEWNHKRVYRIYCELELNLRILPLKRLKRPKPDALVVPEAPNQTWAMDFIKINLKVPNPQCVGRLQSQGAGYRSGLFFASCTRCAQLEPDDRVSYKI